MNSTPFATVVITVPISAFPPAFVVAVAEVTWVRSMPAWFEGPDDPLAAAITWARSDWPSVVEKVEDAKLFSAACMEAVAAAACSAALDCATVPPLLNSIYLVAAWAACGSASSCCLTTIWL